MIIKASLLPPKGSFIQTQKRLRTGNKFSNGSRKRDLATLLHSPTLFIQNLVTKRFYLSQQKSGFGFKGSSLRQKEQQVSLQP